jgi:hypothetical protein
MKSKLQPPLHHSVREQLPWYVRFQTGAAALGRYVPLWPGAATYVVPSGAIATTPYYMAVAVDLHIVC